MPEIHIPATTEEMMKWVGATKERQRIRAKVEEMRSGRLRDIPAFSNELARAELQAKADALGELLRWLDEEAS